MNKKPNGIPCVLDRDITGLYCLPKDKYQLYYGVLSNLFDEDALYDVVSSLASRYDAFPVLRVAKLKEWTKFLSDVLDKLKQFGAKNPKGPTYILFPGKNGDGQTTVNDAKKGFSFVLSMIEYLAEHLDVPCPSFDQGKSEIEFPEMDIAMEKHFIISPEDMPIANEVIGAELSRRGFLEFRGSPCTAGGKYSNPDSFREFFVKYANEELSTKVPDIEGDEKGELIPIGTKPGERRAKELCAFLYYFFKSKKEISLDDIEIVAKYCSSSNEDLQEMVINKTPYRYIHSPEKSFGSQKHRVRIAFKALGVPITDELKEEDDDNE